jgi:hypothetical protein
LMVIHTIYLALSDQTRLNNTFDLTD